MLRFPILCCSLCISWHLHFIFSFRECQLPYRWRRQVRPPIASLRQVQGGPPPHRHRQFQAHVPLPQVRGHERSWKAQEGTAPASSLIYSLTFSLIEDKKPKRSKVIFPYFFSSWRTFTPASSTVSSTTAQTRMRNRRTPARPAVTNSPRRILLATRQEKCYF